MIPFDDVVMIDIVNNFNEIDLKWVQEKIVHKST